MSPITIICLILQSSFFAIQLIFYFKSRRLRKKMFENNILFNETGFVMKEINKVKTWEEFNRVKKAVNEYKRTRSDERAFKNMIDACLTIKEAELAKAFGVEISLSLN